MTTSDCTTDLLSSPSLNLSFNMADSVFYKKNAQNFILQQFAAQTPALQQLGLLDIYLSKGHSVEPHWHPNSAELVYMVQGEAIVSVLNPLTLELLTYQVKPPQTVFVPMGWWHWEIAVTDCTHMLAVFNNSMAQTVFGSDVLRKTPPEVFQLVYGIQADQLKKVLAPIQGTVIIGGSPSDGGMKGQYGGAAVQWRIGSGGSSGDKDGNERVKSTQRR